MNYKTTLERLSSPGVLPRVSYHTLQAQSGYYRPGNRSVFAFQQIKHMDFKASLEILSSPGFVLRNKKANKLRVELVRDCPPPPTDHLHCKLDNLLYQKIAPGKKFVNTLFLVKGALRASGKHLFCCRHTSMGVAARLGHFIKPWMVGPAPSGDIVFTIE